MHSTAHHLGARCSPSSGAVAAGAEAATITYFFGSLSSFLQRVWRACTSLFPFVELSLTLTSLERLHFTCTLLGDLSPSLQSYLKEVPLIPTIAFVL